MPLKQLKPPTLRTGKEGWRSLANDFGFRDFEIGKPAPVLYQ